MTIIKTYVSGSWGNPDPTVVGWAFIAGEHTGYGRLNPSPLQAERLLNIGGEMKAAMEAVDYCLKKGITHIELYHTQKGVALWALGWWFTATPATQAYAAWMQKRMKVMKITFMRIPAGNNPAGSLARKVTGATADRY